MTACGAEAAAARSAMNTGSESGGAAGPPASPMRKSVASICAGGASGAVAGPALTVVAWPHPSSPMHRRSEEHTSELQSPCNLVCRLLLEKKKQKTTTYTGVIGRNTVSLLPVTSRLPAWIATVCIGHPRTLILKDMSERAVLDV